MNILKINEEDYSHLLRKIEQYERQIEFLQVANDDLEKLVETQLKMIDEEQSLTKGLQADKETLANSLVIESNRANALYKSAQIYEEKSYRYEQAIKEIKEYLFTPLKSLDIKVIIDIVNKALVVSE